MACVRMDMSDPTARKLCFTCGASWISDVERCRDCGSDLLAREQVEKEFEGSTPAESLPEFSSLELLCAATGEAEQRRVRERLEEYEMPYFCFSDDQGRGEDGSSAVTTNFYIADLQLDWARANLTDLPGGGRSVLLIRTGNDLEAAAYRAALEARNIGYTTNRFTRQYAFTTGALAETMFFVAEVDVEAARLAIEDFRHREIPVPDGPGVREERPADDDETV